MWGATWSLSSFDRCCEWINYSASERRGRIQIPIFILHSPGTQRFPLRLSPWSVSLVPCRWKKELPGRNCPQIFLSWGRWCLRWSSRAHGYWLTHGVDLGQWSVLIPFSVLGMYIWAPFPQWEPLPRRRPGGREWCVAKTNWIEYVTEAS